MPFSRSTFTVEIDGVPTFVFQATRQIEAEEICSEWCAKNLQHLIELNIIDARASTKVRIARSNERTKFETEVAGVNIKGNSAAGLSEKLQDINRPITAPVAEPIARWPGADCMLFLPAHQIGKARSWRPQSSLKT